MLGGYGLYDGLLPRGVMSGVACPPTTGSNPFNDGGVPYDVVFYGGAPHHDVVIYGFDTDTPISS